MTEKAKDALPPPDKLTPADWAKKLGPKVAPPHLVASASYLHGWKDHAYHYQAEPLLLEQGTFLEALKAASAFPTVAPHAPAFGKTVGERFKDFKPQAAKAAAEPAKSGKGS